MYGEMEDEVRESEKNQGDESENIGEGFKALSACYLEPL